MDPRLIIIDDSEDFRLLAHQYLLIEWPGSAVEEWDPNERGKPGPDFDWGKYDAVLLDYQLGREDGLEWLKEFHRIPACPPVIFLTGEGNEDVAVKAMKYGAADYLRKHDLSKARLISAINSAISERMESSAQARAPEKAAAPAPPPQSFQVKTEGETGAISIEGYRLIRKIGEGGMSSVYLTERLADGLHMVLKILDSKLCQDQSLLKRFVREYGILSKLNSPYVVKIYDQGFTNAHVYIAMEHFAADDLRHYILLGLAPRQALALLFQVGKALQVIHKSGVIHRDLKPQNIMFRVDGSLALLDFGVSKELTDTSQLTRHGQVFGTPQYMSPEHGQGKPTDARSDLYGLGVVFYEMLTGNKPYQADNPLSVVFKHATEPIPTLSQSEYQPLLDRLLAKKPDARYQNAQELLSDIEKRWGVPPAVVLPAVGPKTLP